METKSFSLQSPEVIAKEYGGDKVKIAQAAQMGLLDPTAAVLAGMFIDRIRNAQAEEQVPQQTIAQQVLAPQTQMPDQQMPQQQPGLGAMQADQMMPPEAMPPQGTEAMPAYPVSAAEGGLMSLPVDESMFQQTYGGGGVVAFAQGEDVIDPENPRIQAIQLANQYKELVKSGNLSGATRLRKESFGANPFLKDLPDVPQGQKAIDAVYDRLRNLEQDDLIQESGALAQGSRDTAPKDAAEESNRIAQLMGILSQARAQNVPGVTEHPDIAAYRQYITDLPKQAEERRKQDMWSALAQFGFNLAGTESPRFLQALGQAGAATMPAIMQAAAARRGLQEASLKGRYELAKQDEATRMALLKEAADTYGRELDVSGRRAPQPTEWGTYLQLNDILNNPNSTPEQKAAARKQIDVMERYRILTMPTDVARERLEFSKTQADEAARARIRKEVIEESQYGNRLGSAYSAALKRGEGEKFLAQETEKRYRAERKEIEASNAEKRKANPDAGAAQTSTPAPPKATTAPPAGTAQTSTAAPPKASAVPTAGTTAPIESAAERTAAIEFKSRVNVIRSDRNKTVQQKEAEIDKLKQQYEKFAGPGAAEKAFQK